MKFLACALKNKIKIKIFSVADGLYRNSFFDFKTSTLKGNQPLPIIKPCTMIHGSKNF